MTVNPMLAVQELSAWYGGARILYDMTLDVAPGEVVALMGRNGAGKSTTMKAIMGLIGKRAGHVEFCGRDISRLKTFEIARLGLGFVPEDRRIFSELTVMENLDIGRQPPRNLLDGTPAPVWTPESSLYALSQSRPHAGPARQPHERRRAADADGRPHLDGQSASGAA